MSTCKVCRHMRVAARLADVSATKCILDVSVSLSALTNIHALQT